MDLTAKLAQLESQLKEHESKLAAEQKSRLESEQRLQAQLEASKRDEEEQKRLRKLMQENEERMRKEIEEREKELEREKREKETTLRLLKQKEDQISDLISNRSVEPSIISSRKSSVAESTRPCECFETGFQACVLYPKEYCNCSSSCTFVRDYLAGAHHDHVEVISMRSYSGIMTPVNGEAGEADGNVNSAKLLNGTLQDLSRRRKSGMSLLQPPSTSLTFRSTPSPTSSTTSSSSGASKLNNSGTRSRKSSKDSNASSSFGVSKKKAATSESLKGASSKPLKNNNVPKSTTATIDDAPLEEFENIEK